MGGRALAIVDVDPAWEGLGIATHRIARVPPGEAGRLAGLAPLAVLVNLAAPGGCQAVRAVAAGIPVYGCLAARDLDAAVLLRRIATADSLRPPDAIRRLVQRRRTRRPCVVAAGRDAGALLALRRTLAADGYGVSLAWDDRQVRELYDLVGPQVVVLALDVPRSGHDVVAWLGLRKSPPDLVLVATGDDAPAFEAALRRACRHGRVPGRAHAVATLLRSPVLAAATLRVEAHGG
jgi:hypothetical protein